MFKLIGRLKPKTDNLFIQLFYYLNLLILVVTIALSPAMLYSIYQEAVANSSAADSAQLLAPGRPDFTSLDISIESVDPAHNSALLTVAGHNHCTHPVCDGLPEKLFLSTFHLSRHEHGLPAVVEVDLPKNGTVFSKEFSVPIDGMILPYPFDQWKVDLAVALARMVNGKPVYFTAADGIVSARVDEDVARMASAGHQLIDPRKSVTLHDDMLAVSMKLERPFYTRYLTTVMVILLTIATISTIAFSNYSTLIMSSAGIIFGLWGARGILIGNLPADSTYIDIVLILIVLTVLLSVAVKTARYIRLLPPPQAGSAPPS